MNLVSFSIRTKAMSNFARRLRTVFTRFGFSDAPTRRALDIVIDSLQRSNAVPTFFIPAVVLRRHPAFIAEVARYGTEIGIHGYVHNDYHYLSKDEQYKQTKQAISVFEGAQIPYHGFRNPYLGWTAESLHVFAALGLTYESNEAVIHDDIDLGGLYTLNLHPERAIPCQQALDLLLSFACTRPLPVWIAGLKDGAWWWKERSQFRLIITPRAPDHWMVEAICTPRASLLARHLTVEDQAAYTRSSTTNFLEKRVIFGITKGYRL
jgi:hypothetical protein